MGKGTLLVATHLLPGDEMAAGWSFEHLLPQPVRASCVKFNITPKRLLGFMGSVIIVDD